MLKVNNNSFSLEMIEYLLSQETLLKNSRNFYGETALFLAVKYKHAETAKMLLQAGVNVNLPNNEEITPLHKAVNQPELAHLLIKNGAFIDALDYSGESPLHDAVVVHNLEVVCMLLYYNADPNLESENCLTPFMKAIINEDVEIQTALIDYVIDFNARTTEGMTLLALALTHTTPFVEEIIKRGANINYHINNNECFNVVDILCHRVPSTKNFRLVWNKYVHNDPYSSVLTVICESQLSISIFYDYINTIIDSENVINAVQPFINDLDFLISEMQRIEFPLRYITEVVCVFLSYGKNMCSSSMDRIFSNYNYCELFKIGLHMDINITESFSFLHLLYDPSLTMEDFIKKYITYIEFGLPIHNEPQMLRYCNIPRILEAYVEKDRVPMCLEHLLLGYEEVPRLLDLSRNVTRDYIIKTFNIKTSGDYITTVNSMNLCQPYKKILTYETPLYDFEML